VSLPRHLQLEALTVCCPGQPVFLGLDRALAQCRSIHVTAAKIHLLLRVSPARGKG
jgi:hypothetical protein